MARTSRLLLRRLAAASLLGMVLSVAAGLPTAHATPDTSPDTGAAGVIYTVTFPAIGTVLAFTVGLYQGPPGYVSFQGRVSIPTSTCSGIISGTRNGFNVAQTWVFPGAECADEVSTLIGTWSVDSGSGTIVDSLYGQGTWTAVARKPLVPLDYAFTLWPGGGTPDTPINVVMAHADGALYGSVYQPGSNGAPGCPGSAGGSLSGLVLTMTIVLNGPCGGVTLTLKGLLGPIVGRGTYKSTSAGGTWTANDAT